MIQFIFGAAGSGKTSYIYRELTKAAVANPHRRYYLFVPEQNTLKAQQELIRVSERHGLLNLDVLSFQLLAYRVMDELSVRRPDILDEMSKSMFLRRACQDVRGELAVYGNKLGASGFIRQIKALLSEFYQYEIGRETLSRMEDRTESALLRGKLHDVRLICTRFQELLQGKAAVPEEIPAILLKLLGRSSLLRDSVLVFDGYTGFTPIQLSILAVMMGQAASLSFALTIPKEAEPYRRDYSETAVADLWWLSRETVAEVCELAEKNGIRRGKDIYLKRKEAAGEAVCRVLAGEDPIEEAHAVAADIAEKARAGSLRYRSIAVAVTDPEGYREILRRAFDNAGLLYFMDDQADSTGSAAALLLRGALAVITGGYQYDDVVRYAKNVLHLYNPEPLSEEAEHAYRSRMREAVDLFDNYLRAKGIRGRSAFARPFESGYRGAEGIDLAALNACRTALMEPLFALHDALLCDAHTGARVRSLYDYMEAIGLAGRMSAFLAALSRAGMQRECAENERFWKLTRLLFERLSALMGGEELSLRAFSEIIDAGFADLKAGMIPQTMDMITVGDLKRSRFDGIDALYIVGANEGLLPAVVSGGGIFTDYEREEMMAANIRMAPSDRQDSCIQQFYLYLLTHKPQKELIVSFAKSGRDGKSRKPAELVREIEENGTAMTAPAAGSAPIASFSDACLQFAGYVRDERTAEPAALELYQYLRRKPEGQKALGDILSAAGDVRGRNRIAAEVARKLYGASLYGSVTRIELYERCAYAHFLRYGLGLLERQQFDIEASDLGTLYHSAIEAVFRGLEAEDAALSMLSDAELSERVQAAVREVTDSYNDRIMQSTARSCYLCARVERVTGRTLWALKRQAEKGDFKTFGCELPFCLKERDLELHGRIDRVDTCALKSEVYVKVIDYKSGSMKFDLSLAFQGLQLQLVTYMQAAIERVAMRMPGREILPAGLFYYHIDDPVVPYASDPDSDPDADILMQLRMNGLVNADPAAIARLDRTLADGAGSVKSDVIPVQMKDGAVTARYSKTADRTAFSALGAHVRERIARDAEAIFAGDIRIEPYRFGQKTGCDYCPYHSICGFDARTDAFHYRNVARYSDEEVFAAIARENVGVQRTYGQTGKAVRAAEEKAVQSAEKKDEQRVEEKTAQAAETAGNEGETA